MNRYLLFLLAFLTGIFIYILTEGNNFSIGGDTSPRCSNFGDKNTTILDLSNCKLSKIPDDLKDLKKLKTLNLQGNTLSGSQTWSNISQVKELDLSDCDLTKIPNLKEINNLERLNLTYNTLSGSLTWSNISQVKELDLTD